jgi:hypothetical protein
MNIVLKKMRQPKLFDVALLDLLGTVAISVYVSDQYKHPRCKGIMMGIGGGIVTHKLLEIDTKLNYYVGLSNDPRG